MGDAQSYDPVVTLPDRGEGEGRRAEGAEVEISAQPEGQLRQPLGAYLRKDTFVRIPAWL